MSAYNSNLRKLSYEPELYHNTPACRPDDVICPGSDTEESPEETRCKHQRYEDHARRCAAGILPVLQSTCLRGPLSRKGWVWENPWKHIPVNAETEEENDEDLLELEAEEDEDLLQMEEDEDLLEVKEDLASQMGIRYREEEERGWDHKDQEGGWWQPGSDMLFTRENVMKKAAAHGRGHLSAAEALRWCKDIAAKEAITKDSIQGQILMSVEKDDRVYAEDTDMDYEYPAVSSIPTPHQGAIISNDDDSPYMDQYGSYANAKSGKKRRIDSKWLKGSYMSKRARWDDGPVLSPTPLPNAYDHQQRGMQHKNFLRHEHEQSIHISTTKACIPSVIANVHSKIQSKNGLHKEEAILRNDNYSERSKGNVFTQYEGDSEDMDELSGSSQDPVPTLLYSAKVLQKRHTINPENRSFSDLEQDDLAIITPRSKVKMPLESRSSPRQHDLSSIKLPKLQSKLEYLDEDSFVTEIAPSSRNVEKFKFKKKRRRRTDDEITENKVDLGSNFVRVSSTTPKQHFHEDKDTVEAPGLSTFLEPSKDKNHNIEIESIPFLSNRSKTSWNRSNNYELYDDSSSDSSALGTQLEAETLLKATLPSASPTKNHSQDLFPKSPHLAKEFLPNVSHLTASPTKTSTQITPLQPSISSVPNSVKQDFVDCVLPKFDWEDTTQTEMDRIQLSLSQACSSSSEEDVTNMEIEALGQSSKIQQCGILVPESNGKANLPIAPIQPRMHAIRDEDGEKLLPKDIISPSNSPIPKSIVLGASEPQTHKANSTSSAINFTSRQISLPPLSNCHHSDSHLRSSQHSGTQILSPLIIHSPNAPLSPINQNNINTQSYNTSPLTSQQRTAIDEEDSLATEMPSTREDLPVREDCQSPFTKEQEISMDKSNLKPSSIIENEEALDVDVSGDVCPTAFDQNEKDQTSGNDSPTADVTLQTLVVVTANATSINLETDRNQTYSTASEEIWEGCEPQSPWAAESSQPLAFLTATNTTVGHSPINTEYDKTTAIQDSNWESTGNPQTPKLNVIDSLVKTPLSGIQTSGNRIGDKLTGSENSPVTISRNPWASCLKNKSSMKSKKRVSFGIVFDQGEASQSTESPMLKRSPPPPEMIPQEDDSHDEDAPIINPYKNKSITRRFNQILPDHIHSQEIVSSPALGAQAEAFIAADREVSTEQEYAATTTTHDSPLRLLQPRSEASDNAIWGSHDEQSPFQVEPPSPTTAPMPEFDMEEALGEIGEFLGEEWSVDAELKKAKESSNHVEDTVHKRRRLFGLV